MPANGRFATIEIMRVEFVPNADVQICSLDIRPMAYVIE